MTQSTQKKKGRKPKAKMAVVTESATPVKAKEVKKTEEKVPVLKVATNEVKTYQTENWVATYVNSPAEPTLSAPPSEKNTPADLVSAPAPTQDELTAEATHDLDQSWFAVAHEYTEKKSIWQKIVSFFKRK